MDDSEAKLRTVLDAIEKNGTGLTQANLQDAKLQLEHLSKEGGVFKTRNLHGEERTIPIDPTQLEPNQSFKLILRPCQSCDPEGRPSPGDGFNSPTDCPIWIIPMRDSRNWKGDCCATVKDINESIQHAEQLWLTSQTRANLIEFFAQHVASANQIDQIVCFGLGDFSNISASDPVTDAQSLDNTCVIQHLAALKIRRLARRFQHGDPDRTIKIFAQDPDYCAFTRQLLTSGLPLGHEEDSAIEVVYNPEAFFLVNANTFVLSIYVGRFVPQVVAESTAAFGGPAGVLCGPVLKNPRENSLCPELWRLKQRCFAAMVLEEEEEGGEEVWPETGVYLNSAENVVSRL
ncbi:hypothetical protein BDV96DRAFT_639131 [Lophiotrema nucula]|uniref:SRR1-like domain-containing protein n=1 Tax=Lophiotrema nucula TaxID=690887 RepID=A0A6A5ZWB0_9PLEO|nr:hypothetical protein BDV96DRAFT_639131 [Lophiotrema nucula]